MIKRVTSIVVVLVVVGLVAAVLYPVFAQAKACSKCVSALSDVKQMGLGMFQYAADHDERFTPRDAWVDAVFPYVKNERLFHSPKLPRDQWGYAFNGRLSGAKPPIRPETVPMIYDSVNPWKNASDLVTSLPRPGRHNGRNMIAYADGHAGAVAP